MIASRASIGATVTNVSVLSDTILLSRPISRSQKMFGRKRNVAVSLGLLVSLVAAGKTLAADGTAGSPGSTPNDATAANYASWNSFYATSRAGYYSDGA